MTTPNAAPVSPPTTTEFRVYYRSHRTGHWQFHHGFQSREFAIASANTVSQYASATVNETVVDAGGGVVSENQIFEAPMQVAS